MIKPIKRIDGDFQTTEEKLEIIRKKINEIIKELQEEKWIIGA